MQFSRRMYSEDHSIHPVIPSLVVAQVGLAGGQTIAKNSTNPLSRS
jgi:hypothetical protein